MLVGGSAPPPCPYLSFSPTPRLSQLVTFPGEGVEEGKLSLCEGASGRGTGRFLGTPTVKEEIQGLLGRAGGWGIRCGINHWGPSCLSLSFPSFQNAIPLSLTPVAPKGIDEPPLRKGCTPFTD